MMLGDPCFVCGASDCRDIITCDFCTRIIHKRCQIDSTISRCPECTPTRSNRRQSYLVKDDKQVNSNKRKNKVNTLKEEEKKELALENNISQTFDNQGSPTIDDNGSLDDENNNLIIKKIQLAKKKRLFEEKRDRLHYAKLIQTKVFPKLEPVTDIKEVESYGFRYPVVIPSGQAIPGMQMIEFVSWDDILQAVGENVMIPVIDVSAQVEKQAPWTMKDYIQYMKLADGERERIYNVLSLELSDLEISKRLRRPKVVDDTDLITRVWPFEMRGSSESFPKVQMYLLMSPANAYTDFHIDFGGTSVFYHILSGSKLFFAMPPTDLNLHRYKEWCLSNNQNNIFLADSCEDCKQFSLKKGETLFLPSGWIHAVFTPEDSVVIGGNFIHEAKIEMSLKVQEIEKTVKTPARFRLPHYDKMCWYIANSYVRVMSQALKLKNFEIEGLGALNVYLLKLLQGMDSTKRREFEQLLSSRFQKSMTLDKIYNDFNELRLPVQKKYAKGSVLHEPLSKSDPTVFNIIEKEKQRQRDSINLIASENFASLSVMQALGSVMQNKYSEGYPGARYYGGTQFIDEMEVLCQQRAMEAFGLDPEKWGVNVQSLSGSPANLQVYYALMKPHDRLMGLDLPHGGHLSHGYQTATKKVSAVSTYFETLPYQVDESTGLIDYGSLARNAKLYRPKIIIAGASSYPRHYNYKRMREICDSVNAYLMSDMAHISGLVAAGLVPSPFEYSDVVTTTTHKSLRGPRGALIFYRKGEKGVNKKGSKIYYELEDAINFSVFPGHQGGPHNHTISALAVALKQAYSPEFKDYQKNVLANCQAFAKRLIFHGYSLVSHGTDNHLLLMDLRSTNIDGARLELVMGLSNIVANKNTVPGDSNALAPKGLRMGTPAMTTRGFTSKDFEKVADFVHEAITICRAIVSNNSDVMKLKDFKNFVESNPNQQIIGLKAKVLDFVKQFPTVAY